MFDLDFLSFLDPMRQMAGAGASFPFGAPSMDQPNLSDVTSATAPQTTSWGAPPVPGTPQGAANRSSMMVAGPGAPSVKPATAPPLPPPRPVPGAIASNPSNEKQGEGPPLATPQQAAASRVTPGTPAAVSGPTGAVGPDGKPITTPAADPALRAPYANPGSPVPGAAPGAAPATAPQTAPAQPAAPPGGSLSDKLKALSGNKDFMGALGKMAGGGGGGGGGGVDLSMSGIGGDPAAGSRQGASDLFKSILEGNRPPAQVGAVPEFDPRKFLFSGGM